MRRGLDRIEAELSPSGYLVGEAFSVADLTAASLLAPLVRPPGTLWAQLGDPPEPAQRIADEVAGRKAFQWVVGMFHRHRGSSAAIEA